MSLKSFLIQIFIVSIIAYVAYVLFERYMDGINAEALSLSTILFFVLNATVVYFLAKSTKAKESKFFFVQLVIGNMFFKVVGSLILIVLFVQMTQPSTKYYLLPFAVIYLIFTIFETYFLSVQAKAR